MRLVQLVSFAVQSKELFSSSRKANNDRQRKPAQIVSVNRFAGLKHHIVRNIDDIVDGTETGGLKPTTHPIRAWTNGNVSNLMENGIWACLQRVDANLTRIRNQFGTAGGQRVRKTKTGYPENDA